MAKLVSKIFFYLIFIIVCNWEPYGIFFILFFSILIDWVTSLLTGESYIWWMSFQYFDFGLPFFSLTLSCSCGFPSLQLIFGWFFQKCSRHFSALKRSRDKCAVLSSLYFLFRFIFQLLNVLLLLFKVEMVLLCRLALFRGFLFAPMMLLVDQLMIFVAFACQTVLNFHSHFV